MGQTTYGVITSVECARWFTQSTINATIIILINNNYTFLISMKDGKPELWAATHINLPKIYPKYAELFPTPSQFKWTMLKSENKVWLLKLLKHRFKATAHIQRAELIYCERDVAENLTSRIEENDFDFQQVKTNRMILSAYTKLWESCNGTVIINSEDTDVYGLLELPIL